MVDRISGRTAHNIQSEAFSGAQTSTHSNAGARSVSRFGTSSGPLSGLPPRKYKTVGMLKNAGFDKDLGNAMAGVPVDYLSSRNRAQYLVESQEGRLYHGTEMASKPLDTRDGTNPQGAYLFAMDERGEIFAAPTQTVKHHSAFLAGNPVAAAGAIAAEEGRLTRVTDHSGHYAPPLEYSHQFTKELDRRGVDMSGVAVSYQGASKKALKKANAEANRTSERMYPEGVKKKKY